MSAMPSEASFASIVVSLLPFQRRAMRVSRLLLLHFVSWIRMIQGFSKIIFLQILFCLVRPLLPLTFHEIIFIRNWEYW